MLHLLLVTLVLVSVPTWAQTNLQKTNLDLDLRVDVAYRMLESYMGTLVREDYDAGVLSSLEEIRARLRTLLPNRNRRLVGPLVFPLIYGLGKLALVTTSAPTVIQINPKADVNETEVRGANLILLAFPCLKQPLLFRLTRTGGSWSSTSSSWTSP